jgi:predicted alpha/beta superfamily hydrolase
VSLAGVVNRLKPLVDSRRRALPARDHAGIGGSGMGGLISLYAALAHPDIFSEAGQTPTSSTALIDLLAIPAHIRTAQWRW